MEVSLPTAYDGDDLQVHLIHEVILPEPVDETPEDPEPEILKDEEKKGLPSIGLIAVLAITMFAGSKQCVCKRLGYVSITFTYIMFRSRKHCECI